MPNETDEKDLAEFIPLIRSHSVADSTGMKDRPTVKSAKKAANLFDVYLKKTGADIHGREYLLVMLLNSRRKLIGIETVGIGKLDGAYAHPREIFLSAIIHKAASVYVAHTHPSGDASPSVGDEAITTAVKTSGGILDIPVEAHLILTGEGEWKEV